MRAVVMTISTSLHWSWNNCISASRNSLDISFAYPPEVPPSSTISTYFIEKIHNLGKFIFLNFRKITSRNSAPMDSTCSFTAGRTSKPLKCKIGVNTAVYTKDRQCLAFFWEESKNPFPFGLFFKISRLT